MKIVIGDATLYRGDCFGIMPALSGVNAVITDPPYGCTSNAWDVAIDLGSFWSCVNAITKENAAFCIFSMQPFTVDLIASNRKNFRYELIYKKYQATRFLHANRMPLPIHENIEVFYRKLPTYNPQKVSSGKPRGDRLRHGDTRPISTNWDTKTRRIDFRDDGMRYPVSIVEPQKYGREFTCNKANMRHPTQKPVALMEWLVKTYTNPGDLVLDPFMGGGATGVACIKTGRRFIGIEKEERYFELACGRIDEARQQNRLLEIARQVKVAKQAVLPGK